MFRFINKTEYFEWIERFAPERKAHASATENNLKDVQDHYILSRLSDVEASRIVEVGGADCRVLQQFSNRNECWNAEKFTGAGIGPKKEIKIEGIRNALVHLGEFSPDLPDAYFDYVFSISVVEHVLDQDMENFFNDIARILKPGGRTLHAIDLYAFDTQDLGNNFAVYSARRMELYASVERLTEGRLKMAGDATLSPVPVFSCSHASNADREMLKWNKYAPQLTEIRAIAQSTSLILECVRS